MPAFLKQPWSNKEARFAQYGKIILKALKNCFPIIQSRCSIYYSILASHIYKLVGPWNKILLTRDVE